MGYAGRNLVVRVFGNSIFLFWRDFLVTHKASYNDGVVSWWWNAGRNFVIKAMTLQKKGNYAILCIFMYLIIYQVNSTAIHDRHKIKITKQSHDKRR